MAMLTSIERWYHEAKRNKWFRYFTISCRIALALGFIPSGLVKIMGERFTALSSNHPLGQYFDALYLTGYYYTFIGVVQVATAILLIIPRTALLGALIYFPIILNICILTYSVRFEGTRITTFMVLANLYLLCWDYDRLKHVLPFYRPKPGIDASKIEGQSNKFPFAFFGSVIAILAFVVVINSFMYDIRPGNSLEECSNGCGDDKACQEFCDCIHNQGNPLSQCLDGFEQAKAHPGE